MKLEDMECYFTDNPDNNLLRLAGYDKPELIKELVENRGADVNARSKRGTTPLHEAAVGEFRQSSEIISYLISKGADVNAENSREETPLDIAAKLFKPYSIRALLKYKAKPNTKNIIELKTIASQNYDGVENIITQIQNIDALRDIILKLEESETKDNLLDKLARQETKLTEGMPKYFEAKVQQKGYKNLEEKLEGLKYLTQVAGIFAQDIKAIKGLPIHKLAQISRAEKEDLKERLDLMESYLGSYQQSIQILKINPENFIKGMQVVTGLLDSVASGICEFLSFKDLYKVTFLNKQLKQVTSDDLSERLEALTLGETDTEEFPS